MTSQNFCYWLQGKLEIDGKPQALTAEQVAVIAKHLALVFKHEIDPSQGSPTRQEELNEIHNPPAPWKKPPGGGHSGGGLGGGPLIRC